MALKSLEAFDCIFDCIKGKDFQNLKIKLVLSKEIFLPQKYNRAMKSGKNEAGMKGLQKSQEFITFEMMYCDGKKADVFSPTTVHMRHTDNTLMLLNTELLRSALGEGYVPHRTAYKLGELVF